MSTDHPIPLPRPTGTDGAIPDADGWRRPHRPDPLLGKVLVERYRVVGLVARGGMGRVYRAEQAPLGRVVAIKVLDVGEHHDHDQEFRRRFVREAETCARLTHPHTVRVFDHGKTHDDILFIVMEYLEGRNLYQAIQTDAPMDAPRVTRIGRQIAASLREAHALGLIHRDLKPSNIILTRPGGDEEFVKVVDFGLVKEIRADAELTRDDALVGSPSYMSPEQIRSAVLDQRSDLYSLGVLLYTCLTGRAPFVGATSLDVLMGHLHQPPPPMAEACPSMKPSPALEAVVLRCLAKAPADRYASMDELLRALQVCEGASGEFLVSAPAVARAEAPVPVATHEDAPVEPLPTAAPRRADGGRLRAVALGVLGLVLLAGSAAWWTSRVLRPPASPASLAAALPALPPVLREPVVPAALDAPLPAPDRPASPRSPSPIDPSPVDPSPISPSARPASGPRVTRGASTPAASAPIAPEASPPPQRSTSPTETTGTVVTQHNSDVRDPWADDR